MESSDFGSVARRLFDALDRAVYLGAQRYDALIGVEMDPASPGSILAVRTLSSGLASDIEELDYRRFQIVATVTAVPGPQAPAELAVRLVSADSVAESRFIVSSPAKEGVGRGRRRLLPSRLSISCVQRGGL